MPTVPANASLAKIGLISGGGALPARLAAACAQAERPFHVIRLKGFADETLAELPGEEAALGEVGAILRALRDAGCEEVALAGRVSRPSFGDIRPDLRGARLLPKVVAAAAKGDGALLNVLVQTFEQEGFRVVGADDVMAELLVSQGPQGLVLPQAQHFADVAKAADLISALGPFDVGQAAVVCDGLVLAVEAAEGTDAMLSRCAGFGPALRGVSEARRGVLVKAPKPGQERRVDLPTIGAQTIELAAQAGLAGVAVAAGSALLLDRDLAIRTADAKDMFVFGFTPEDLAPAEEIEAAADDPAASEPAAAERT